MELKLRCKVYVIPSLHLLIVPYGIETFEVKRKGVEGMLLIVPYGIETYFF